MKRLLKGTVPIIFLSVLTIYLVDFNNLGFFDYLLMTLLGISIVLEVLLIISAKKNKKEQ